MLMLLTSMVASFTSCSSDDDPDPKKTSAYDQVKFFQSYLAEIDSDGNLVGRMYGAPLDGDTTTVYIGVESQDEAYEIFRRWLSMDIQVSETFDSGVEVDLKDAQGTPKETVYFTPMDGDGVFAQVTFKYGDVIKHVSKVVFIDYALWKAKGGLTRSLYNFGDMPFAEGNRKWLCIREARPGIKGLLIIVEERECGPSLLASDASPKVKECASVLRKDFDTFATLFKAANLRLEKDKYYNELFIHNELPDIEHMYVEGVRLSDGDTRPYSYEQDGHMLFMKVREFDTVEDVDPYAPVLLGQFSVSPNKKVRFTRGNLYWDGKHYRLENNQFAYPMTVQTSHIGHFFWSSYSDSHKRGYEPWAATFKHTDFTANQEFWCSEKHCLTIDGVENLYCLTDNEWKYLMFDRPNADNLYKTDVKVNDFGDISIGMIFAPDGYKGKLKDAMSVIEIRNNSLVFLPYACERVESGNIQSCPRYWTATPARDGVNDVAICVAPNEVTTYMKYHAYPIRLVQTAR